jgi:ssDNA-binding Zn-finger/Zn-ribbon topoisomerase 1
MENMSDFDDFDKARKRICPTCGSVLPVSNSIRGALLAASAGPQATGELARVGCVKVPKVMCAEDFALEMDIWEGPYGRIEEYHYVCRENDEIEVKATVYRNFSGDWHAYASDFKFWDSRSRWGRDFPTLEDAKKAMEKAVE